METEMGKSRTNTIDYTIFKNREYRYYHEDPNNNFSFHHPIYLINNINYYSGKTSTFEYYHQNFGDLLGCGLEYSPIYFSNFLPENGCNTGWAERDNQTNYMIKNRTSSNKFNGVVEPVYLENYTYEILPHESQNPYYARTKNIYTTIVKQNLIPSDTTAPPSIIRVLNFTKFKFPNYGDQFEDVHPIRAGYSTTIKLVEESIHSGSDVVINKYNYDYDSTRGLSVCNLGTYELLSKSEKFNNLPEKITTYNKSFMTKSILQSGSFGNFNSIKDIPKQVIETDPVNIMHKSVYNTNFFDYLSSNTNAFYNIKLLSRDSLYSSSFVKMNKAFDYYQGAPEGIGKLKWTKIIDPLISNRETKIEYFYITDTQNKLQFGALTKISLDNGLEKRYFYPEIDENFLYTPIDCKWVRYDDSISITPGYRFYGGDLKYREYPYKIQTVFGSNSITTYQDFELYPSFKVDENGYGTLFYIDAIGRIKLEQLPGSFVTFPDEFGIAENYSNSSKISVYDDGLNYKIDTLRFNNTPSNIDNLINKNEYYGYGQIRKSYVLNSSGIFELKLV